MPEPERPAAPGPMLVYDPATNPLNNNEWAFPLTECFHVAAMALSVGTIVLVDLRLLGLGMRHQTAAQLLRDTELWTLAGLATVITSGLVIFSSDPVQYLGNGAFRFKMAMLSAAILYNYTFHRQVVQSKVAQSNAGAALRVLTGGLSLALWVSPVFAGIFIAFA
jgi:hypothetical protein